MDLWCSCAGGSIRLLMCRCAALRAFFADGSRRCFVVFMLFKPAEIAKGSADSTCSEHFISADFDWISLRARGEITSWV